jgi:hypothetical protein
VTKLSNVGDCSVLIVFFFLGEFEGFKEFKEGQWEGNQKSLEIYYKSFISAVFHIIIL